jgi:hypothetical protein
MTGEMAVTERITSMYRARRIAWLAVLVLLLVDAGIWAAVGDEVALKARNRLGVPMHPEPRGTHDFQRVPDGTRAMVIEVAPDGRWLTLAFGWPHGLGHVQRYDPSHDRALFARNHVHRPETAAH